MNTNHLIWRSTCDECGREFRHGRRTARFCCAACRARNYRRHNPLWRLPKNPRKNSTR